MNDMERRLLEGTIKFWKDEAKESSEYALSLEKEVKDLKQIVHQIENSIPELKDIDSFGPQPFSHLIAAGWNSCIDEFKRLNKE